jgi:hypothetical protein
MSLYVPYYHPYNKHNTNIHAPGEIRTHDPSKRAAEDPRLRPHGHWDRLFSVVSMHLLLPSIRVRINGASVPA